MKKLIIFMLLLACGVGEMKADVTWTLRGTMNNWSSTDNVFTNGQTTVTFTEGQSFNFKIVKQDGNNETYYTANSTMTWDNCTNWDFNTVGGDNNNCTITGCESGAYTFTIDVLGSYPVLTVTYPKSSVVYFCNNLNWTQPYAYILGTEYWNNSNGSGSSGRYKGIQMTQIGETTTWKGEFPSTIASGVIAFLKDRQDNFENYHNTQAVYKTDYNSSTPLFVPSTTKSGDFNGTEYYSDGANSTGEWHVYPTYTRSVTSGNFGTICLPFAATVTGATVYKIVSKVMSDGNLAGINLESVDALEAGKAYIFKATGSTLTATYSGSYTAATEANGMLGNLSSATTYVPQNSYVVSSNQIHKVTAENGVTVGQYRAYITLTDINEPDVAPAPGLLFMPMNGSETTGINAVNHEPITNNRCFNLNGQRVTNPSKGLYIVNGKKVVLR